MIKEACEKCIKVMFLFIFLCRKGDYYRYLAEFKTGAERKEAADESLKAYQVASFLYRIKVGIICFDTGYSFNTSCLTRLQSTRLQLTWLQRILFDLG